MKASLFLLFVFFAVALCGKFTTRNYQQQCRSLQCEKAGETCGYVNLQTTTVNTACINADTHYCNITQSGTGIDVGQCIEYASAGQSCQNRQCGLGLRGCSYDLDPVNTCVPVNQRNITHQPGQPCGSSTIVCNYNSLSGDENTCVNGVCKFNDDGASCDYGFNQCKYTSSCVRSDPLSTGTCQSRFALGSACIANLTDSRTNEIISNDQCQENLNCMPTVTTDGLAGTCRDIYSQKEKAPCKDHSDCKDGVCSDPDGPVGSVYWGVCVDFRKTSTLNKRCADDDDCTESNGEYCVCVDDDKSVCKNTNLEREYYDDIQDYNDCKDKASVKCDGLEDKQKLQCYLSECKKDVCSLYKSVKKIGFGGAAGYISSTLVGTSNTNAQCAIVQVCDASALFTSFPILVALAAIVLLLQ